ncbi:MAG: hypothetical protein J0L97_02680 [Alphaproteobacteria bacterium]|nr:hypothetical protein [Alphaproteobacteria bacterium]
MLQTVGGLTLEKVKARIRSSWNSLTEDEIGILEKNPMKFYALIETRYGLPQREVRSMVTHWQESYLS